MEITAIQCPKCGSTQKTEIKTNRFRCDSCGTEYVLDYGNGTTPGVAKTVIAPQTAPVARYLIAAAIVFLLVFLLIFFSVLSTRPKNSAPGYSANAVPALPGYSWSWRESTLFHTADNRAILLSIGRRRQEGNSTDDPLIYAVFSDAANGTKIQSFRMKDFSYETRYSFREFSSGEIYLIAGNSSIYRVDKSNFSITDVTHTLFDKQKELVNGIAQVDFLANEQEDGLSVMTNDGSKLNYFPLIHKVYSNEALWAAEKGFDNLLPGAIEKTGFTFCWFFQYNHHDDVQKSQLIRYRYMDNVGGPKESAGVLPKGVNDQNQKGPRVISYTDFTPGRQYFSEKLFYYDSDYVLIACKPTAAVNGDPPQIQCFDARTAKILFTVVLPDATNPERGLRSASGFSILNYNSVYNIGFDGKINHITKPKDYEF